MEVFLGLVMWVFTIVGIVTVWKKYTVRVTPRDPDGPSAGGGVGAAA